MYYTVAYSNKPGTLYSEDQVSWSSTAPEKVYAGTYTTYCKAPQVSSGVLVSSTYYDIQTITSVISKASMGTKVMASAIQGLYYSGSAQNLVTQGEISGGECVYCLYTGDSVPTDLSNYSTSIPTAINAGEYKVAWTGVLTDSQNYYDAGNVPVRSITATI